MFVYNKDDVAYFRRSFGLLSNLVGADFSRGDLAQLSSLDLDAENRQFFKECGYPSEVTAEQYRRLIKRNGLARRVCHVQADESWAEFPDVYETEDSARTTPFETKLDVINPLNRLWAYCHRADQLSLEGRFGGLFLGMSDTTTDPRSLERPVRGFIAGPGRPPTTPKPVDLLYMTPLAEGAIVVNKVDDNPGSPRFNQPTEYTVYFGGDAMDAAPAPTANKTYKVHWSRVVHLSPNSKGQETYGDYTLDPVVNYLLDARKVGGSSAEMFFKGGFPGWAFQGFKELAGVSELDEESVREQLLKYMNGLQRYLASSGGEWKSLAPNVADPTAHMMVQYQLIGAAIRCPVRVLIGSEAAHLASTQDMTAWNNRIQERRTKYLNVFVIRALIERLIGFGVLPRPKSLNIAWTDLNLRSSLEAAEEALKQSQALMQYMTSSAWAMVRPTEYLTMVARFTPKQAAIIVRKAGGEDTIIRTIRKMQEKVAAAGAGPQGGGRTGKPNRTKAGKTAGKTPTNKK